MLKTFTSAHLDRTFPGSTDVDWLIDAAKRSDFAKETAVKELESLWLIMDSRSSDPVAVQYRALYANALRRIGAKPPRLATVNARPITREEFEAATGVEREA